MEIGLHVVGSYAGRTATEWDDLRRIASQVEDSGLTHLFLGENHLTISELTLRMLEAARVTEKIKVGPGATNLIFRHETSLLCTVSTLADLAGADRIFLGLSAGDTALRMMGIPSTRATDMRTSVANIRALMRDEPATYNDRSIYMRGLTKVPIYMFAEGPKMMAAAAELADVIVYGGGVSPEAIQWAKGMIESASSLRGDDLPELTDWYCSMISIGATEDDARQRIASRMANRAKHNLQANPDLVPEDHRDEATKLLTEFNPRYWEASNGRLMTPYMFERFGVVGTIDKVRERLIGLRGLGVTRLMIDFAVTEVETGLRQFADEILPDLVDL